MPPKKANALAGTLHDAETRQLEDFIKKRSKTLDNDINEMRKRLGTTSKTLGENIPGVFSSSLLDGIKVDGVSVLAQSHSVSQGHGAGKEEEVSWGQGTRALMQTQNQSAHPSSPPRAANMRDRLGTFLARIKLRLEDQGIHPSELRNLLLPADLCLPTDTQVSISDLMYVLQTDLVLPVSREDQLMLLQEYGDNSGEVNVRNLLTDAGVWHEMPHVNNNVSRFSGQEGVPRKAEAAMTRIRSDGMEDPIVSHHLQSKITAKSAWEGDSNKNNITKFDGTLSSKQEREGERYSDRASSSARPQTATSGGMAASRESEFAVSGGRPVSQAGGTRPPSSSTTLADDFQTTGGYLRHNNLPFDTHAHTHANEKYGELIDRSASNFDVLSEIHRIVASDLDPPASPGPQSQGRHDTLDFANAATKSSPTKISFKTTDTLPTTSEKDLVLERTASTQLHVPQASPTRPGVSAPSSLNASAKLDAALSDDRPAAAKHAISNPAAPLALAEENARLRSELSAFDTEFWEQLEDLKFRYTRLQEVVGEEPEHSSVGGSYPMRPNKVSVGSTQRNSLEGMPWSARNAMTAMDRAGITSSLARGRHGALPHDISGGRPESRATERPHAHAYTYAPGTKIGNYSDGFAEAKISYSGFDNAPPSPPHLASNNHNFAGANPRAPPPSAPLLRHSTGSFPAGPLFGGIHGVGGGTHAPDGTGSLASMCERRLLFELGNHPAPEHSARSLIHRIQDIAHRKGANGRYITPTMLSDVLTSVGLRMSMDEVTLLATGFGSNGRGGIDSEELCEALQALLYNFIGEHEVVERERRSKMANMREVEQEDEQSNILMTEICMNILTHDRKAVLAAGASLYDTLVDPFASADNSRLGVLPFNLFSRVLRDLGVMLDHQENVALASRFEARGAKAAAAIGREHSDSDNRLNDFRDDRLMGALRGGSENPSLGNWLASNLPSSSSGARAGGIVDSSSLAVDYIAFVEKLADMMEDILQREGGFVPSAGLGAGRGGNSEDVASERLWMLREFDLIEALICQLELMKPSERRRCLLSLQYAVTAADSKQEGEIDGFSLLSALLGAGFRLQRLNRVRLLRAIEDLGGKMDYVELCQVLIRSCADWTSEERGVVLKILKAMGITVLERRAWLGRIRVGLMKAAVDFGGKAAAFNIETGGAKAGGAASGPSGMSSAGGADPGIPPSAFLHILRESGVILGVEEEATLLDCLDTERLAESSRASENSQNHGIESGPEDGINRALASLGKNKHRASAGEAVSKAAFGNWGVPLIHYKNFLTFCARHTGDWMDASPSNTEMIHEAIRGVNNPATALQEFTQMIQAFDETSSGVIGNRAFQIACHRSRLFANLSDEAVKETANILTAEGGGKIRYMAFLVHLRAVCSQLSAATEYPGIGEQLLKNAMDSQGTLLPLRNWLLRNTDAESCLLTPRDINALLREFSVMYRPEDLEALMLEIGQSIGKSNSDFSSRGVSAVTVLDSRDLFRHLFKIRGPWTLIQTELCQSMTRSLAASGANMFASGEGANTNKGSNAFGFPKSSKGIESAAARRLLARLRAFADIVEGDRLVDLDIFGYVARATGMPLSDEELLTLADATDPNPSARQVRCDVVMEALTVDMPSISTKTRRGEEGGLPDAAQHALKHLQDQIWKTGVRLRRSPVEWIADVKAAFKGFDLGGAGFVTSEDFTLALTLLNAPVSTDILRDIPTVPDGPGLIAYTEILERALVPPPAVIAQARVAERGGGGAGHKSSSDLDFDKKKQGAGTDKLNTTAAQQGKRPLQKDINKSSSPVSVLISVVRKALHSFISTDASLESAWMCLLKAFRRFDPNETGNVPPREFCLAVSVLLGGDEVLLSEAAWIEIVDAFTVKDVKMTGRIASMRPSSSSFSSASGGGSGSGDKGSHVQVSYMEFAAAVLDSKDIKATGRDGATRTTTQGVTGGLETQRKGVTASGSSGSGSGSARKYNVQTQGSQSRERAQAIGSRTRVGK